jgi:hypothetical protein
MSGKRALPSKQTQAERFAEAARAVGADESEAAFRDKLSVIARQRPTLGPQQDKTRRPQKKGE